MKIEGTQDEWQQACLLVDQATYAEDGDVSERNHCIELVLGSLVPLATGNLNFEHFVAEDITVEVVSYLSGKVQKLRLALVASSVSLTLASVHVRALCAYSRSCDALSEVATCDIAASLVSLPTRWAAFK